MDDFNPLDLALEGVRFLRQLDLEPAEIVFGQDAWESVVSYALANLPGPVNTDPSSATFLGLPIRVDPRVPAWTVQVQPERHHLPLSQLRPLS